MKRTITFFFSFFLFLIGHSAFSQMWFPPVPLVAKSSIKDVAKAAYSDSLKSYVIEYNPEFAQAVGPYVTAYLQAHEYGHIHRGHVSKKKLQKNDSTMLQMSKEMELGADLYAIENLHRQNLSILLGMEDFLEKQNELELLVHLPRKERLQFLKAQRAYFSTYKRMNVACRHKLHDYDQTACTHFNERGQSMHSSDSNPCVHVTHLSGDEVVVKENKSSSK